MYLSAHAVAPLQVDPLIAKQDEARVVAVLAEVGGRAPGVEALDGIEPGQLVGAGCRGQPTVAIYPPLAAVVSGQYECPAITLAGGLVSVVEPTVVGDQRAQCPARIERLIGAEGGRIQAGDPPAVPGMNCARPWAPTGERASARQRLSW